MTKKERKEKKARKRQLIEDRNRWIREGIGRVDVHKIAMFAVPTSEEDLAKIKEHTINIILNDQKKGWVQIGEPELMEPYDHPLKPQKLSGYSILGMYVGKARYWSIDKEKFKSKKAFGDIILR